MDKKIDPDLIFFASGNQSFSINLALEIKEKINRPLITFIGDNYRSEKGKIRTNIFQKFLDNSLDNLVKKSNFIFSASEKMTQYLTLKYNCNVKTFYRPFKNSVDSINTIEETSNNAVYIGNLALGRDESLIELSKELIKENIKIEFYTPKIFQKEIKKLKRNGLIYKGQVLPDKVISIYQKYQFVIHVESHKSKYSRITKYSYSTKIPELLSSGRPILAYGPKEISSIEEFINNQSAIFIEKNQKKARIKLILI